MGYKHLIAPVIVLQGKRISYGMRIDSVKVGKKQYRTHTA